MIHVCANCGQYRADKNIEPAGPFAVCPECGQRQPFCCLPLLVISGASGCGKTTVGRELLRRETGAVLLDSDVLWRPEFNTPETKYREFFETWLRMAMNINQSGRPVALLGAGCGVPDNLEPCVGRRYFSRVYYHALVCSDAALESRLRQRPAWRGSAEPEFLQANLRFNQWFKDYDDTPEITLTDTTSLSVEETAERVSAWMEKVLNVT